MNCCRGFVFVTFAFAATAFAEKEIVLQPDVARLGKLPVNFIENRGQWNASAKFVAHKGNWAATLEKTAIALRSGTDQSPSVRLVFEGASDKVRLVGEGKREGRYNFFIGNDPAKWQADVPAFRSVLYRGIYGGVNVRVREEAGRFEYDLLVAPNADLKKVVIHAEGATGLELADDGALLIKSGNETLRQPLPQTWEVLADGSTRLVECRFRKIDTQRYGFVAPKRHTRLAMLVDPGLEWSTFLGGAGTETVTGMKLARDGSGDIILSGQTDSADFPHTNGHHAPVGQTPYVARLNAAGSALVYCTFFGGTFNHSVLDLALDPQSQPIIVGDTNSLDFPTTPGAYDRTPGDGFHGDYDAYVIKFNSTGNAIVFGTYLGSQPGSANLDQAWAVALDTADNVIVAGITTGDTFPTTPGAYDRTANVYIDNSTNPPQRILQDIFIARLNPTGSQLTYSTFFGGQGADYVYAMAVDSQNVVTITGKTAQLQSFDANGNEIPLGQPMPTTAGAFDTTYNGAGDAYIARFKLDGAGAGDLRYASFLGGRQYVEAGDAIALNPTNEQEVTVSGFTRSGDFPTTPGALLRTHFAPIDGAMAFVTRFNFASTTNGSLVWSTFFGAPGSQSADAVVVDSTGAATIAGAIGATNPPTTERSWDRVPVKYGAYDRTPQGVTNAYVARISADGSQLLYSTLLGGAAGEGISKMALVGGQTVVVAGTTRSVDFPVTAGAFDTVYGNDGRVSEIFTNDVFVSRLTLQSNDTGDTTPPPAPGLLAPANASSFTAPTQITLDWSDVSDASGIEAYHVQLSPDPNFVETAGIAGNFHENWLSKSFAVVDRSISNVGTFYWRVQALDRAHNMGPWSAVRTLSVQSPGPSPTPPASYPVTVAVNPTSIVGGGTGQGTATLQNPAPSGGAVVELFSHDTTLATVPPSLTIPAGARSVNFTVTSSTGIGTTGAVGIAGRYQGITNGQLVMVFADQPSNPLYSFALNPTTVTGGSAAQGTVALGQFWTAPPGGLAVALASSNPQMAAVPASVTIPAGANSATFAVTTQSTNVQTTATIFASRSRTISATLTINPAGPPPPPAVYAMEVFPATVTGGSTSQGTVSINADAPGGGTVVTLSSSNTSVANVPASVTVPAGAQSANFNVTTSNVQSNTTVIISGTAGGATKTVTLGVNASAQPTPTPTATPRATPTPTPTTPTPTATPIATPTATPAATLSSLTLNPTSVNGGDTSQGTVTLSAAAPAGGAVVAISSNNSAATVPSSVTIPSGATSRSFTVTTSTVNSTTTAAISAVYNGVTRTSTLTIRSRRGH